MPATVKYLRFATLLISADGVVRPLASADTRSPTPIAFLEAGSLVQMDEPGSRLIWAQVGQSGVVALGFTALH